MKILEKDPYYEVGTIDDIVISQSSLKYIDPKRNGSPRKFKQFFEERIDKPSAAMLRGTIFHLYCENPEAFVVSEATKPSEKLGVVADAVVEAYESLEDKQSKDEMLMMLDQHILRACRAIGWNNNWKDEAIIKNSQSVATYLHAVYNPENEGKIILTSVLKEQIEKCIQSLKENEYASRLLFWKDDFSKIDYYKEIDIYWGELVDGEVIKCKAKLDDLVIDHEKEVVRINDPKTTGGSAYNFEGTFKSYRLDIQFNMYERAFNAKFPEFAHYKKEFRNIVVETSGLFETVVHKWHNSIIAAANEDLDNLFRRVIHAINNGYNQSLEEFQGKGEIKHRNLEE